MEHVGSLTEKALKRRREERRNWTQEDEQRWLETHPGDEPLPEYQYLGSGSSEADPDLVPEIEPYERSDEDEEVDAVLDRIGIVEAYNKWAGKGHVDPKGRTESIKVRCPNPSHPDHNPSAWLNTDKEVWVCGGCGMDGGDKFDIAAWALGYSVPGYKDGKKFPQLRRDMAVDLGYTVRRNRGTGKDEATKEPEPPTSPDPSPTVTSLHPAQDEDDDEDFELSDTNRAKLHIPWREFIDGSHFLEGWMEATSKDDLPEEYYFWAGLVALGLAAGNDVYLSDHRDVYGNLFATVVGSSGSGKSRSISNLHRLIHEALPYEDDPSNTGVKTIPGVSSGEALIDQFCEIHEDDNGEQFYVPVRALIDFNELASMVGKSASASSILKPVLMNLYDKEAYVATSSRTHGNVRAEHPFAACVTSTQPKSVRNLVTAQDVDSGFMNRWVFVYGVEKEKVAYGLSSVDLSKPIDDLKRIKAWAAFHRNLGMALTGEALELWSKFFHETLVPVTIPKRMDEENALFGRLVLTFKKLMLLFAIDAKETIPSKRSVEKAIALWPYLQASYIIVSGNIASTVDSDLEDSILTIVKRYHENHRSNGDPRKGPRRSDIADALRQYPREDVKRAISRLEELEIITEQTRRGSGTRGPSRTELVLAYAQ